MQGFEGRPHPKGVLNLVQGIFHPHFPTWVDVQTLLDILLSGEEKTLIITNAREEANKTNQNNAGKVVLSAWSLGHSRNGR